MGESIVTSDYLSKLKYKVTKSLVTKRNKSEYSADAAQARASYLADKLNNPTRVKFYLKCAWNLTDPYLDRVLAIALKKDDPKRYFSYAASNEMRKNG